MTPPKRNRGVEEFELRLFEPSGEFLSELNPGMELRGSAFAGKEFGARFDPNFCAYKRLGGWRAATRRCLDF